MLGVLLASLGSDATISEVLLIRHNGPQCERMERLNEEEGLCLKYQKDFYLYARGCPADTHTCSDCSWGKEGDDTQPTTCRCEYKWFQQSVGYNDRCDASRICSVGECYRPCDTFLQSTRCPFPRCRWDTQSAIPGCVVAESPAQGNTSQATAATSRRLKAELPFSLKSFSDYLATRSENGVPLLDVLSPGDSFRRLDRNSDGQVTGRELVEGLDDFLETAAVRTRERRRSLRRRLVGITQERRLQGTESQDTASAGSADPQSQGSAVDTEVRITADYCYKQGKRYCSFNQACISDCVLCGWHTATDLESSRCVPPNPKSCMEEGKIYCASDETCHPFGECKRCQSRPIADYSQFQCLAPWWYEASADVDTWVCRYRNKCGRMCHNDQDCLFGLKRCIDGACAPLRTKDTKDVCAVDEDCPHLGYYCPTSDDPSYVRICQPQKRVGDKCATNTNTIECQPDSRCNTAEIPHRCRRLFSLELGYPSSDPLLCTFGVKDAEGACTVAAQSKSVSQPCDFDTDCETTIEGVHAGCRCKAWWDSEDSRYCLPVAGDYANHNENLRNYVWFVAQNCGSFWTEDECLEEFKEARRLKLTLDCETQQLSGGPFVPHPSSGLGDGSELVGRKWVTMSDKAIFVDYCLELQKISAT